MTEKENRFHQEMVNIYKLNKQLLNYTPTRFLQMVNEYGGIQAAKKLLATSGGESGFLILWQKERLDLSMEALVLKPEYHELFTQTELDEARKRLTDLGYLQGNQ